MKANVFTINTFRSRLTKCKMAASGTSSIAHRTHTHTETYRSLFVSQDPRVHHVVDGSRLEMTVISIFTLNTSDYLGHNPCMHGMQWRCCCSSYMRYSYSDRMTESSSDHVNLRPRFMEFYTFNLESLGSSRVCHTHVPLKLHRRNLHTLPQKSREGILQIQSGTN